jgi:hypothetical protein
MCLRTSSNLNRSTAAFASLTLFWSYRCTLLFMDTKLYSRSVRANQPLSLQRLFELHSCGFRARMEVAHLVPHATGVRGVMTRHGEIHVFASHIQDTTHLEHACTFILAFLSIFFIPKTLPREWYRIVLGSWAYRGRPCRGRKPDSAKSKERCTFKSVGFFLLQLQNHE